MVVAVLRSFFKSLWNRSRRSFEQPRCNSNAYSCQKFWSNAWDLEQAIHKHPLHVHMRGLRGTLRFLTSHVLSGNVSWKHSMSGPLPCVKWGFCWTWRSNNADLHCLPNNILSLNFFVETHRTCPDTPCSAWGWHVFPAVSRDMSSLLHFCEP